MNFTINNYSIRLLLLGLITFGTGTNIPNKNVISYPSGEYDCSEAFIKFHCKFNTTIKEMNIDVSVFGKDYDCQDVNYLYNPSSNLILVNMTVITICFDNKISKVLLQYLSTNNQIKLDVDFEKIKHHCILDSKDY